MKNKDLVVKDTRIAELRLDNDLKQKDIAFILNVKENNYSKLLQILITSPVAFICVLNLFDAKVNLSNGNLAIFVTT